MSSGARQPWDRLPEESPKAHAAFVSYRSLPPSVRSIAAAIRQAHGEPTVAARRRAWHSWSSRFRWVERVEQWDEECDRVRQLEAIEAIAEMNARHIEAASAMMDLARRGAVRVLEKLAADPSMVIPPKTLASVMQVAAGTERLARGVPASIEKSIVESDTAPVRYVVTWADQEDQDDDDADSGAVEG